MKLKIPCFNATEPGEDDKKAATGGSKPQSSGTSGSESGNDSSNSNKSNSGSSGSGSSRMGAGAMAGTIVGSLVGASMLAVGGLFLYRRRQQRKRQLRLARMEENARHNQYPLDKVTSGRSV